MHRGSNVWAGLITLVEEGNVYVTVDQEKWRRGQSIVTYLQRSARGEVDGEPTEFNFKVMKRGRGCWIHLAMTYPDLTPFLKGIHLTLDSWRAMRDHKGQKIRSEGEWLRVQTLLNTQKIEGSYQQWRDKQGVEVYTDAPSTIKGAERLQGDLSALEKLLEGETPLKILVRGNSNSEVMQGFGDVNDLGFGAAWCGGEQSGKISPNRIWNKCVVGT